MSETDHDFESSKTDDRIACKYGDKCYQKNADHLRKYKHPPKKSKRKNVSKAGPSKRFKVDEAKTNNGEKKKTNEETVKEDETFEEKESKVGKKECISSSDSEHEGDRSENLEVRKKETISSSDSEHEEKSEQGQGSNIEENDLNECKTSNNEKHNESEQNSKCDDKPTSSLANQPFNPKTFIKSRFLIDLPEDFYDFWEFCKEIKPNNPSQALKDVDLELVGPFDVLADKFKHIKRQPDDYLRHWRYYYDPPELITVLKGNDRTGYHIGYFFDSPEESPAFLVSNHGVKDGVLTKMGDNIFAAVSIYLEELKKTGDPFKKMHVGKYQALVKTKAEKLKLNLSSHSQHIKKRESQVVAKTSNKVGLVLPYNKKTQLGYRDLAMGDKDLMTLLNKIAKAVPEQKSKFLSDLQPVLTYTNIALDECDFGTGVKLGWEILFHGVDSLNNTIARFLSNSYRLLNKQAFAKIAEAHMSNRKKGCNLSII